MATFEELLERTSRTFALAVPLLPSPIREQVGLAYLLLRIADTLEDAEHWSGERRVQELIRFAHLVQHREQAEAEALRDRMAADSPSEHAGYRELLAHTPEVIAALEALPAAPRGVVVKHVQMTVEGMASTVERMGTDGRLALRSLEELRRYCYVVAGLVGELLTELFLIAAPSLLRAASTLRRRAREFGEGLQLTNILKDSDEDAAQGRRYLPAGVNRPVVFSLARADLDSAAAFVNALFEHGAPKGIWAFAALPLRLAQATLALVEAKGASAKLSRERVAEVLAALQTAKTPSAFLSA
jgi:farnesyl-diphosphate farnesyltransferase